MPAEAYPNCSNNCALAGNGHTSQFECLAGYLSNLKELAKKKPPTANAVREVEQCVDHNLLRSNKPTDADKRPFNCKRPTLCPECGTKKHLATSRRLLGLATTNREEADNEKNHCELENDIIAGSFAGAKFSLSEAIGAIDHAVTAWGSLIRTKSFNGRVASWGRTLALLPIKGDKDKSIQVKINVVMRLHSAVSNTEREATFYAIGGTLAGSGYRPIRMMHLNDLTKNASSLAVSGFDLSHFCRLDDQALQADPEVLWPLHSALKGRRLVVFGGTAAG